MSLVILQPQWVIVRELPQPKNVGLMKSADALLERTGFGEVVAVHPENTIVKPGDIVLYNDLMSYDIPKRKGYVNEPLYAVSLDKIFAKFAAPVDGRAS